MPKLRFLIFILLFLTAFDAGLCQAAEDSREFSKLRGCVAALSEIGASTISLPSKLTLQEAAGWVALRRQLAAHMEMGDQGIKSFVLDPSLILSVDPDDLGRHGVHGAIHDSLTKQGPAVLKVYKEEDSPSYVGLYIQTIMGGLGLAPKVFGTIDGDTLWKRFGIKGSYGLLMEKIDIDGSIEWKYKGGKKPEISDAQIEAAEKRLSDAGRIFSYLHILPGDLDAVITKTGELLLIDFDAYYWVSDKGTVVRNTNVGDYPIPPLDSNYPKSLEFWIPKNRLIDDLISSVESLRKGSFREKIKFGAVAPSLDTTQSLSGETFDGFKKGQIYIVEIGSTRCGPCMGSLPHLDTLQKQYKGDVKVINILVNEVGSTPEEIMEGARQYFKKNHPPFSFPTAVDTSPERAVYQDWINKYGLHGIPAVFIVDQEGKIAFMSDRLTALEAPLNQVIAGTWYGSSEIKASLDKQTERRKRLEGIIALFGKISKNEKEHRWQEAADLITGNEDLSSDLLKNKFDLLIKMRKKNEAIKYIFEQSQIFWNDTRSLLLLLRSLYSLPLSSRIAFADKSLKVAQQYERLYQNSYSEQVINQDPALFYGVLYQAYSESGNTKMASYYKKKMSTGDVKTLVLK